MAVFYHYYHQGSHKCAWQFYLETAHVKKAALGKSHLNLSITYYTIWQIYYQQGKMDLVVKNFWEALSIERECFGNSHPTCAKILNKIGKMELQRGDIDDLIECYVPSNGFFRSACSKQQ